VRTLCLIAVEHLVIVIAVYGAAAIRIGLAGTVDDPAHEILWRASLIGLVLQICLHYSDLYDFRTLTDRRSMLIGLIQALGSASVVLALLYYWIPDLIIGRGVFVIASAFIVSLVAGWRLAFEWLSVKVGPSERLLIVGTGDASVDLARELFSRRHELGVELVGFVDPDPARIGTSLINPGIIGTLEQIPSIVRDRNVDRVVVSLADARGKLPMDALLSMKLNAGVQFDHLASVYEEYTGKIAIENLRPSWLIFSSGFRKSSLLAAVKRAVDLMVSAVGLTVVTPVLAVVAIAVRVSSSGPALYHQLRVGKGGRIFTIYKFRSMRHDAEVGTGAVWSTAHDPRVTPVGRFLRRTRLDELPQLWNVLVGDMSLVGPRPERPEFVSQFSKTIPGYVSRHCVKVGITGWAQVHGWRGNTPIGKRIEYDLYYIENWSVGLDVKILWLTVKWGFTHKNAY
jgi:exopolysaccharide biosynthesis polyprenyl glycosylphosphotransferase